MSGLLKAMAWWLPLVLLCAAPWFLPEFRLYQISLIAAVAIVALGVMVVTGLTGQITLAQAAFAAVGAYGSALLVQNVGVPFIPALFLSGILAAMVGFLLGLITIRVSGHYLALATLAVTAILQVLIIEAEWLTGGAAGMPVPQISIAGRTLSTGTELYFFVLPLAVLAILSVKLLIASRFGRALAALRQSEIAAGTLGIDVLRYKAVAFAVSAFFGSIGGGLTALLSGYLDPMQFGVMQSVHYVAVAVLGGLASPVGAVFGSALFVVLPELLVDFKNYAGAAVAIALVVMLILRPEGVLSIVPKFLRGGKGWQL